MLPWIAFILLRQAILSTAAQKATLSNVQVLLPYTASQVEYPTYTLLGYGGCFNWASTDRSVVKVNPLSVGGVCSQSAQITVQPGNQEEFAIIQATDPATNQRLECKVRVGRVASISLNTKSKFINRDELVVVEIEGKDRD
eukprot:Ihof_evm10s117 gene=Ihof_evmTU10s117